jgi:hypothetical protein
MLKNILIAVPTMGGMMRSRTATTLVMLMKRLTKSGINAEYLNIDSSDIVYARNLYAQTVLNDKALDGLLFVDSDMAFRPLLVQRMIDLGVEVAAAAYPKRKLDIESFARSVSGADSADPEASSKALAQSYEFTVLPSWETAGAQFRLRRGFTQMAAAGMGCALISRRALEAMIEAKAVERRRDVIDGVERMSWTFFDPIRVGETSLSEDFSFCYRWTKTMCRPLWVCVDEYVTHLGEFPHRAKYLDRLARLPAAEAAEPAADEVPAEAAT